MFANQNPSLDLDSVIAKLKEKGVKLPCPRCGQAQFSIVGEATISLDRPSTTQNLLFNSQIPTVIIGCDNCGFLLQHAKGPLGLSRWYEQRRSK